MALSPSECGAVILAGGRSRRMGTDKALLPWQGRPLIQHIAGELSAFDEILLSANNLAIGAVLDLPCIPDEYPDSGPLSGLYSALSTTSKEWLFCVPCDLPYFQEELPRLLLENMDDDVHALVCRDSLGNLHPLCGIYSKSTLPILKEQLDCKEFKVRMFLEKLSFRILETGGILSDAVFYNMNTPESYHSETK